MANRYTNRKLEVYTITGHQGKDALDYGALFDALAATAEDQRLFEDDSEVLAIPHIVVADGRAWFTVYHGTKGNPLIFNSLNATERIERLKSGEWVATKTHGLVDLKSRTAIVEYNHFGAKADRIGELIASLSRTLLKYSTSTTVEFVPVVDEEFIEAIDRLERVSLGRVRLTRPNLDWSDHYDRLNALADESAGHTVEVEVTAQRGGSLETKAGVIALIKSLVTREKSHVKNAKVVGNRVDEKSPVTLSLTRYITHQWARVRMTDDGHVDDDSIQSRLVEYMDTRLAPGDAE